MLWPALAVVCGLALLIWSANRFIDGSVAASHHLGISPLLIGMVVVGFGTSAPEMTVSALAAWQGNPGIALGNAYGSNICNIALILGITALINPIAVHSRVVRREMPFLLGITLLAAFMLWNGQISRLDAAILLIAFALYMFWCVHESSVQRTDMLTGNLKGEMELHSIPLKKAGLFIVVGLIGLIASSRILVWGSVGIARALGVSDLIIGLTIVAVGTSLPELASSIAAIRRNEHDIALGNIIGSNIFNTLIVVGIAGVIHPMVVEPEVLWRDMMMILALTVWLMINAAGVRKPGRISRTEGAVLLSIYAGYLFWLIMHARS